MKIGLWIQNDSGEELLIIKDGGGYPRLLPYLRKDQFFNNPKTPVDLSLEEGKRVYEAVTGKAYPFVHATTRQVLWDLIEASLKQLP